MAAKPQPSKDSKLVAPGVLIIVRLLTAVAIIDAVYLAYISLTGSPAAGCGPSSGCHQVLNSRWAYWFGIPVSLFGLLVYAGLFFGTAPWQSKLPAEQQRKLWKILLPCSVLAIGAALWFVAVQWAFIKAFCPFCMTAHGSALIAAVLLLANAPVRREPEKPWEKEKQVYVPPAVSQKLVLAAVGGLVVMVAGQVLHEPASYVEKGLAGMTTVTTVTNVASPTPVESAANPETPPSLPPARLMQLFEGRVELNLDEVPVMGNAAATNVMVSLFDYTCHHCRSMHGPLKTLKTLFSNDLAIVSLPMPLDSNCNPMVTRTPAAHQNACDYARIGLAVWRTQPAAMHTFDDWVFAPNNPPPLDQTLAFAKQLVGADEFNENLKSAWVQEQLSKDVAIYQANYELNKSGSMPQFIVGTNALFGTLPLSTLYQKVTNQFNLRPGTTP